ncbi:MAG: UvrD-helicase domain-containing protein [Clostridia bacterium]|nr:UvrD-helicase domain-containing protein [Clostridia bacterium]
MAKNAQNLKPEQLEAINHDQGNILVSASAGSGKTFVMISRLIRLITEGKAGVQEILAATFTEAAAADMKEKLKTALADEIADGNAALAPELNKVATADICTLHGFCGRLIRAYFFAAGVSPDFAVADESESATLKAESLEETFKEFYAERDAAFLSLVDRYRSHRKDETLKSTIVKAYSFANSEKDPQEFLSAFERCYTTDGADAFEAEYDKRLKSSAETVIGELVRLKKDCEKSGFAAGAKNCESYAEVLLKIGKGGVYAAIDAGKFEDITRAKPPEGKEDLKTRIKEQKSRIKALCEFSAGAVIDRSALDGQKAHGRALVALVRRFAEIYARKKRENNLLDFDDLERFALVALKDESVKAAVRAKYKYVFVDEYQDVNDVQEEIISAVSDGNLFMVGDVKQSIYGFRGCRSEIFERKEKTVADRGGKFVGLNYNFRSAQKVLDMANEIFDFCYVPKFTGLDYRKTARLKAGGIYPENAQGRAELHFLLKEKAEKTERRQPRVYDIMQDAFKEEEKDATQVSNLIASIIYEELTKDFYDVKKGAFRQVSLSDIAVLTRAGDSAYVRGIVEGLNGHGVRVVSDVTQNVCDFPEIKTLINALKLIDNFRLDAPLAGTLLSVIGGFTEEDLAEIAVFAADAGKYCGFAEAFRFYLDNAETPLKSRLSEFKDYFDGLRFVADFKGAKGVLDKIIVDCGYENYILAERGGEEKARRLYKFLAESESGGKRRTVREFLYRTENARDAFKCAAGGEEDAVKVMTIHSSKGLEYPVVIVCGLEKPFSRRDESNPVLFDRDQGFFTGVFDDENRSVATTGYREIIKARARETQIKEEMRVLYVAVTRASYSLHLIFEKGEDIRKNDFSLAFTDPVSFLDFIPKTIPATRESPQKFGLTSVRRKGRKILVGKADENRRREMEKDFSFVYPYLAATALPLKNNVTAIVKNNKEEFYPVRYLFTEENTDTERGTIAHRILQYYGFDGDFDGYVNTLVGRGVVTAEELAKVNTERIKRAIQGWEKELKGKTLYREQDFIVNISARQALNVNADENVLLQGVIDLLAVYGDNADVIDYKYSAMSGESLKRTYAKQLDLYAYAAEKALGLNVKNKILVNIFTGEWVRID